MTYVKMIIKPSSKIDLKVKDDQEKRTETKEEKIVVQRRIEPSFGG